MADEFRASFACERLVAKNCIGAVLRAVVFQRALGNIQPGSRDVLGVTLPCILSAPSDLESTIDGKVDEIYRAAASTGGGHGSGTSGSGARSKRTEATVSFCKEKIKRTWYSKSVEEVPFEDYKLTFEIVTGQTERERNKIDAVTKAQLLSFLMELVTFTEQRKANTPPITSNEVVPFPWKITTVSNSSPS